MKQILTTQQEAYFTKHGYIELEGLALDLDALRALFPDKYELGRDLWRTRPALEALLLRKIGPFAVALSGKTQLRLAFDQWLPGNFHFDKMAPCKDLFSVQGLAVCCLLSFAEVPLPRAANLGILPLPSHKGHLLFFKPTLLLDWPKLARTGAELYLSAYALPASVYVQNPKDPCTNSLKPLGYGFGDRLNNQSHPIISN